jgi:predicted GNAT family N-acyltransferase
MTIAIGETQDIAICRALRRTVFIEEQGVPEADELDDLDEVAIHLLARLDGLAVGSARLLIKADQGKIGRVCVLASARGAGIGASLIRAAVERFSQFPELALVRLGAQTHAMGFYAALGFRADGPEYLDAGILHRDMVMDLPRRAT